MLSGTPTSTPGASRARATRNGNTRNTLMNWQAVTSFILAHPVFCIVLPALVMMQLGLIFIAFRTCTCEECGKPFGIWRRRDQVIELCYRCYRARQPQRRKVGSAIRAPQAVSNQ